MNHSRGVVIRADEHFLWIRPEGDASSCGACVQRSACGMRSGTADEQRLLHFPNTIRAHVGDTVLLCVPDGLLLRAVWVVYGLPLLLAIAFAVIGSHLTGSEVGAFAGMVVGLAGGFALHLLRNKERTGNPVGLSVRLEKISGY